MDQKALRSPAVLSVWSCGTRNEARLLPSKGRRTAQHQFSSKGRLFSCTYFVFWNSFASNLDMLLFSQACCANVHAVLRGSGAQLGLSSASSQFPDAHVVHHADARRVAENGRTSELHRGGDDGRGRLLPGGGPGGETRTQLAVL